MLIPLWMDGDASDPAYRNIRDAKDGPLRLARSHCKYLWIFFQHHADHEFRNELRSNFDARYWEMYLTTSLILAGYSVTCPKPGPDVGIVHRGQRIWFEATSPSGGAEGAPDHIPDVKVTAPGEEPVVYTVPNEKIILRYLNSISVKYKQQYANWLKKGIVSENDCFVIAINPREIPFEHADTDPPRILQAGYTLGPPYLIVDGTGKASGSGYLVRDHVVKAPKKDAKEGEDPAKVATGVFQQPEYNGLSALLCSRVDAANRPAEMGGDFQLAPNAHAKVPLPTGLWLRVGVYYETKAVKDGYDVTPIRAKNS